MRYGRASLNAREERANDLRRLLSIDYASGDGDWLVYIDTTNSLCNVVAMPDWVYKSAINMIPTTMSTKVNRR